MNPNNFTWKRFAATSAGTTVVLDRNGVLGQVIIPANKTGTADFYDSATAAGTTASNLMYSVANTVGTIPTSFQLNHRVEKGLIVITGGTVDFTVTYA